MPTVSYFLATTRDPIDDRHPLWNQPLPISRRGDASVGANSFVGESISYGDYFSAVARFCSESGWKRVLQAAIHKREQPLTIESIERVSIFLVKHGAFYHPARVEVTVAGRKRSLVVNVAISRIGKKALVREARALAHLNEHRPFGWLPTVYATADAHPPMFLGDWFDGFHEFHLTRRNASDALRIVVWDGAATPRLLSDNQAAALYRNMAMILTACYDPITTYQIFPWHHAAGDFVVRLNGDKASVKLITVRNYTPLAAPSPGPADENELLENLLLFFLHLSVRIRLDRLDGVSEMGWAPESCLGPSIEGFFQGLDLTARLSGFPETFPQLFKRFAGAWRTDDLLSLVDPLVESVFDRRSEEHRVIETNLEAHLKTVVRLLNN